MSRPAPEGFEYLHPRSRDFESVRRRQTMTRFRGRPIRCLTCGWIGSGYGAPMHRRMHEQKEAAS